MGIEEAYRTGRAKIKVRAVTNIEPMNNGKNRIVVTELPYMVNKARLIEKIAELVKEYLNFMGADILIVPIDDIDLNIAYAYRMCEQIRKYLCVPQCVVFLSLKIEQLQYVV